MEKAFKYRMYPNREQRILLAKTFGCIRFVYNHYLAKRRDAYEKDGITLNYSACAKDLVSLKKEYEWLKEVDSVALQSSVKNLDTAYINFFRKKAEYPRFKSKKTHRYSYTTKYTNGNIELYDNKVKLPKIGLVKIKKTRQPKGRLLSATVSQVPSGKYYVSLCYTDVEEVLFPLTYNETGIDLGIKDFIVLSNGEKVENPKYLKKSIEKLKKLQKQQSRKTKGGRNWIKNRIKIARLHEKIANQRMDFINKLSTRIIREYDIICIEDLKVDNMLKNHNLAQSLSDVSWSKFTTQLEYKAEWYGKLIKKVDTFYASSQICHCCGYKNEGTKDLKVREWTCPKCHSNHDRDINASINILMQGILANQQKIKRTAGTAGIAW